NALVIHPEPPGVRSLLTFNCCLHQKSVRLPELPLMRKNTLATGTLSPKPAHIDSLTFIQDFHPLLQGDRICLVTLGGIPDGKNDDLGFRSCSASGCALLNSEITAVPSARHEVTTLHGLFHHHLIVKHACIGPGITQMDGTRRPRFGCRDSEA